MRKLILYIAMSLDGFIATQKGDISFLNQVAIEGEDYGYGQFLDRIDTIIIGRKTYEKVLSMGYEYSFPDKTVYVATSHTRPSVGTTHFYTGNLKDLVLWLKGQPGKHIYCDGGSEIVNALLHERLFDEFVVSVIPTLLGSGIRLFQTDQPPQHIELLQAQSFESGLVQLHYEVKRSARNS